MCARFRSRWRSREVRWGEVAACSADHGPPKVVVPAAGDNPAGSLGNDGRERTPLLGSASFAALDGSRQRQPLAYRGARSPSRDTDEALVAAVDASRREKRWVRAHDATDVPLPFALVRLGA